MTSSSGSATGFVPLGDVARERLGEQCQYIARYVAGGERVPALGEGLRFTGSISDYHAMQIHAEDVEEFVARIEHHRAALGF